MVHTTVSRPATKSPSPDLPPGRHHGYFSTLVESIFPLNEENAQEQVVIGQCRDEGEIEHSTRHGRSAEADGRAENFHVGNDQARELGDRNRRHAEIMPGQAQRRHADHGGDQDGGGDADGNADQRRQPEMRISRHRGIGTAAEEHDMADRHLPGIAADDIPG